MFKTVFTAAAVTLGLSAVTAEAATVFATQIDSGRLGGAGWDATVQTNTNSRNDAGNALGAPDQTGNTERGFFSLGLGQVAVLGFGTTFDTPATAFEVTFNCAPRSNGTCSWSETADVYAFNGPYTPFDGTFGLSDLTALGFTLLGTVQNAAGSTDAGASLTFAGGPFRYLALVDRSAPVSGRDGWDIDAVSVAAVPLPAAGLLLLGALGGIAALRRRKTA